MTDILTNDIIIRLFLAAFLGSLVGLEREIHKFPAGIKTHALVCLGSAMFTMASMSFVGLDTIGQVDISRIAAGIVTGIGFLGAGVIFSDRKGVRGLTTAANIWVAAALGLIIGMGEYIFAIAAALIIYVVLILGSVLERKILHIK